MGVISKSGRHHPRIRIHQYFPPEGNSRSHFPLTPPLSARLTTLRSYDTRTGALEVLEPRP
jgi:hypothetical protein